MLHLNQIKTKLLLYFSSKIYLRTVPVKNVVNFCVLNGKKYFLNKTHCQYIYSKIIQHINISDIYKTINKKYSWNKLESKIYTILQEIDFVKVKNQKFSILFECISLKNTPKTKELVRLINSIISKVFVDDLFTKSHTLSNDQFFISYSHLTINLGKCILLWYFENYNVIFTKKLLEDLLIKESNIFDDILLGNIYRNKKLTFETQKVYLWFKLHHKAFCKKNTTIANLIGTPITFSEDEKLLIERTYIEVGSFIADLFINNKLLKEIKTGRSTFITIKNKYVDNIILSTSYIKPILYPTMRYNLNFNFKRDNFTFNINNIKEKSQLFTYKIKSKTNKIISNNEQPFCINKPFFNLYKNYIKDIKKIKFSISLFTEPLTEDAIDIINYIKIHYNFDIYQLYLTMPKSKKYINNILSFIGDHKTFYDYKLDQKLYKSYKAKRKKYKAYLKTNSLSNEGTFVPEFIYQKKVFDDTTERTMLKQTMDKALYKRNLYLKIANLKYFILNSIQDAYLYSKFNVMYIPKHLHSIGRLLTSVYFLSYQTHKFIRGFLCLKSDSNKQITQESFYEYRKILFNLAKKMSKKGTDNEILSSFHSAKFFENFELFKTQTSVLEQAYILSFFNKIQCINDIKFKFDNLKELIAVLCKNNFINKYEKATQTLSIVIYIMYPKMYNNMELILNLDCTLSGTQQIALLFKDALAAKHGCLIGNTLHDIRKSFNLNLIQFFDDLTEYSNGSMDPNNENFFISQFKILISKKVLENNDLLQCINAYSNFLKKIKENYPWITEILTDKKLIKKRLMAEPYGMTESGGNASIFAAINDYTFEKGIYIQNKKPLYFLSKIISNYFNRNFKPVLLPYQSTFLLLRKFLKYNSKEPLSYTTPFLQWSYSPKKSKIRRFNIKNYTTIEAPANAVSNNNTSFVGKPLRRRFINIQYMTDTIDVLKIRNSMCPFIIHTSEQTLVLFTLQFTILLNKDLKNNPKFPLLYCAPVYDCFGTNMKQALILFFILEISYYKLYNSTIRDSLKKLVPYPLHNLNTKKAEKQVDDYLLLKSFINKPNNPAYWDGKITNPFFIKS